jgi:protein-S-isoprenylcysteine O-methyltransferase Ste14
VRRGQNDISIGPYAIVRHPTYSGGLLMILAIAAGLESLSAFACAISLCGVSAARLLDEERYLSRN